MSRNDGDEVETIKDIVGPENGAADILTLGSGVFVLRYLTSIGDEGSSGGRESYPAESNRINDGETSHGHLNR